LQVTFVFLFPFRNNHFPEGCLIAFDTAQLQAQDVLKIFKQELTVAEELAAAQDNVQVSAVLFQNEVFEDTIERVCQHTLADITPDNAWQMYFSKVGLFLSLGLVFFDFWFKEAIAFKSWVLPMHFVYRLLFPETGLNSQIADILLVLIFALEFFHLFCFLR
jgi:hypothetical protein